ncbi:unnamed protein product [Peronospora effusa]|nr:unnamed protein product [Peronospora effusa]
MTNQKLPGTGNGGDAMKMNEVEISTTVEATLDKTMQTKDSTMKNDVASTLNDDKGMGRFTTLDDEVPCDDVTQKVKSKGNLPVSSATVAPVSTDSTFQTVTHNMSNVAETVTSVGKEVAYTAESIVNTATNNMPHVAETVTPVGEKAAYTADHTTDTLTSNLSKAAETVTPVVKEVGYTADPTVITSTNNMPHVAETVTPVGEKAAYTADHTTDTLTSNLSKAAETVTPVVKEVGYTADPTVNTSTNNMPHVAETVTPVGEKAAYAADHTTDTLTNITSNAVMTVTPAVDMVAETSMETVVNTTPYVTKTVAPVAKTATDTVAYTATSPTATTPIPASIPTPLATTIPASSYDIVGQIVDKTTGVEAPSTMPPATTAPTTIGVATTEQSLHRDEEEETDSSLLISQTSADETDLDSDQSIPTSKEITSVDDNADSEDSDSEDSDSEDSDSEDSDSKDRETGGNSVPARKSSLSSGNVSKKPLTTTSPATKAMKSDDSASFAPDAVDRNSGLHSEKSGFTFASPPPADSAFKSAAMKGSSVSDISKPQPKKTTLRPEHSAPTEVPAQPFLQVPVETAPKVPVETAPQVPVETAPQAPVETAPQVPVQTAPQVPIETAPQVPLETAPQVLVETAPQVPIETAPQVPVETAPQVPAPTAPQAPAPTVPQVPVSPVQAEAATASPLSITSDSGLESVEAQAQRAAAVSGDKKDVSSLLLVGVAGFGCVAIIAIVAFMKKPNHVTDETIGPDGERISTTAAMEACNFEGSISNDPLGTRYSSIVMITPNGDGMCIL